MRSNMISQNYTASSFETHHRVLGFSRWLVWWQVPDVDPVGHPEI